MCTSTQLQIPQSDGTTLIVNELVDCNQSTCITSSKYDPNAK